MKSVSRLWRWLGLIFVLSFGALGYLGYQIYLSAFSFGQMGYAAAMAWLLVVIVGALTAVNFLLSKYWVFYDD